MSQSKVEEGAKAAAKRAEIAFKLNSIEERIGDLDFFLKEKVFTVKWGIKDEYILFDSRWSGPVFHDEAVLRTYVSFIKEQLDKTCRQYEIVSEIQPLVVSETRMSNLKGAFADDLSVTPAEIASFADKVTAKLDEFYNQKNNIDDPEAYVEVIQQRQKRLKQSYVDELNMLDGKNNNNNNNNNNNK